MRTLLSLALIILVLSVASCADDKPDKREVRQTRTDEIINFYLMKVEEDPSSYVFLNRLAQAYMQKARETGHFRYYESSADAVKRSLDASPDNYTGLVYMALIKIAEHKFKDALQYAERAVETEPGKAYGYGVLGDAYLDLGNVEEAGVAYDKMAELRPGLDSWSRVSNLKVVRGDTQGALQAMEMAYSLGRKSSRTSGENLSWTRVMKGSIYLNMGDLEGAERCFGEALEIKPDYYLALEHLAEVNAIRGDNETAERLYREALEINPAPEFHLALADLYRNVNRTDEAHKLEETARQIFEDRVNRGNVGYLRALALYYADRGENLERARTLAEKDLLVRKDYGAYDTLGWVYYSLGNYVDALSMASESVKEGTRDAKLYYHLGMINYKMGNYAEAEEYLKTAISINPHFNSDAVAESRQVLRDISSKG